MHMHKSVSQLGMSMWYWDSMLDLVTQQPAWCLMISLLSCLQACAACIAGNR